jgi:hypothetical protein
MADVKATELKRQLAITVPAEHAAPVPALPNPMIVAMDAIATEVEATVARKLGTPKPPTKPKPPLRKSARVRDQGAVDHTPQMNDDDASDTDESESDPDNMSDPDAVEGDSA